MKNRRSSSNTAHFIAKLLAVRPISIDHLPGFIAQIDQTIRRLEAEESGSFNASRPTAAASNVSRETLEAVVQKPRAVAVSALTAIRPVSPTFALPARPASALQDVSTLPRIEVIPARRRGRPPGTGYKQIAAAAAAEFLPIADVEDAVPAQPKLMRRADVPHPDHTMDEVPVSLHAVPSDAPLRGVVKWFDGRAGKGAIRIVGIGDVAIDDKVLERSHINRLYRDQEVEAQVQQIGGKTRLISLAIPGRADSAALPNFGISGESLRMVKRQPRPVVVEIKQDTTRRRRNRSEADQALGSNESEPVL